MANIGHFRHWCDGECKVICIELLYLRIIVRMQEGNMQINAEVWKQALDEIERLSTHTLQSE